MVQEIGNLQDEITTSTSFGGSVSVVLHGPGTSVDNLTESTIIPPVRSHYFIEQGYVPGGMRAVMLLPNVTLAKDDGVQISNNSQLRPTQDRRIRFLFMRKLKSIGLTNNGAAGYQPEQDSPYLNTGTYFPRFHFARSQ